MDNIQNNSRILIIDDNPSIHNDFKKILINRKKATEEITNIEKSLFGDPVSTAANSNESYSLDYALSGEQGLKMVKEAKAENNPYALAFIDVRMPPGWDGIETITRIWEIDPFVEVALCTAYADYSWDEIVSRLGYTDHIIIIKKPFEKIEIKQMATALIKKWNSASRARLYVKKLENKLQNQINVISTIIEFANTINYLKNFDTICDYIIKFTARLINCHRISILLLDKDGETLTIAKSIGIPEDIVKNTYIKIGEGIAGRVFLTEKMLVINNIEETDYEKKYSQYDAFLSIPFICAPLREDKKNLGVINITNRAENKPFTEEDLTIISYITQTAAVALHNKLYGAQREEMLLGSIQALVNTIEEKDPYTRGHSVRVSRLAKHIAIEMNLPEETIHIISLAGLVHDIGKIGIPESILCKEGELTPEEYTIIKEHPVIGEKILKESGIPPLVRDTVHRHHERLDGSGYPDGLTESEINIEARIIAVADSFDTKKSERPHRKPIPVETIKKELMEECGITLDFTCVQALFKYLGI